MFLRRIGLKAFTQQFWEYGVNGRALVLLDGEDYENMGVFSKISIKKIKCTYTCTYTFRSFYACVFICMLFE